jgi:hypothetical protein
LKLHQEWKEWGVKENGGGVNSSILYLMYCKNFCKCHNVPLPSTTIKRKEKKFIISQSWRLQVWDQGSVGTFWEAMTKPVSHLCLSFWWFAGNLWNSLACGLLLTSSLHFVHVSMFKLPFFFFCSLFSSFLMLPVLFFIIHLFTCAYIV